MKSLKVKIILSVFSLFNCRTPFEAFMRQETNSLDLCYWILCFMANSFFDFSC